MNIISNMFSFIYNMFSNKTIVNEKISDELVIVEPIKNNEIYYMFINTANIYSAKELMFEKIKTDYNNKYIKIYLLKSLTLKPLFKKELLVNKENLQLIKIKMYKRRRHLHTFIDAIDSFIEFHNIRNYHIFY